MIESNPPEQEIIDESLTEDISQILSLEAAKCEVCGSVLREGDALVAFAFRPAERQTFQLGHVKCPEHRHEPTEFFTLGVRELILEGRVGECVDQASQSSWPVLLDPEPRAVSPPESTEVHPLPGVTFLRYPISQSDHFAAATEATPSETLERRPWQRAVVRTGDGTPDASPQGCATERESQRHEGGW